MPSGRDPTTFVLEDTVGDRRATIWRTPENFVVAYLYGNELGVVAFLSQRQALRWMLDFIEGDHEQKQEVPVQGGPHTRG